MALFDVRRLDSLFNKPKQPAAHTPDAHPPAPAAHTPAPVVPKAAPVVPKAAPVATDHAPIPRAVPVVEQTPTQADPAKAPAQAEGGAKAPLSEAEQHAQVTQQVDQLKEKKTIMKPGQKGPEVVILQQQLKQLGLHVEQTGVMDKATEGYIMAIQTGGGLGADGIVGPKTLDQLQKLDTAPTKPAPGKDQDDAKGDGADNIDHMPDDPKLAAVYLYNRQRVKNATETLSPQQQKDMEQFIKQWSIGL
ncbi:MAG: peptidoglycan-binding protein [Myxococcales bacterium]|nr:peptidoglycan-binding protein [Myxococcales bacterium]